jgi:hypothetical protein
MVLEVEEGAKVVLDVVDFTIQSLVPDQGLLEAHQVPK